jgi:NitT/TauT family transport system permease protein
MFSGLRTSIVLATTGAVVGEYLGGRDGLGALINIARGLFDTPLVFVAIVWLITITLGLTAFLTLIERRVLRYIM